MKAILDFFLMIGMIPGILVGIFGFLFIPAMFLGPIFGLVSIVEAIIDFIKDCEWKRSWEK